jgi:peptidoglycan/LPS O-acetylase OafA/YrhL
MTQANPKDANSHLGTQSNASDVKELRALTGFRFAAAFLVFVFHVHIRWPLAEPGSVATFWSQGAVGMSMFFMLSGFILSYRYDQADVDFRRYAINRFARIYPIYIFAAACALPYLAIDLMTDVSKQGPIATYLKVCILVFTTVFMLQAWIPTLFRYWNNSASWSLSVEAFFYSIFPKAQELLKKQDQKTLVAVVVIAYVVFQVPIMSHFVFDNPRISHPLQVFYGMPIFRLGEFVIGMIAYLLLRSSPQLSRKSGFYAAVLCFVAIIYLGLFGQKLPFYVSHNWIIVPTVAFSLIFLAGNDGSMASRLLSSSPAVWLGRISYCFYSFQFHALKITGHVGDRYDLNSMHRGLLAFALLMIFSALGYHYIEEPARRWLMQRYHERQARDPASSKVMAG